MNRRSFIARSATVAMLPAVLPITRAQAFLLPVEAGAGGAVIILASVGAVLIILHMFRKRYVVAEKREEGEPMRYVCVACMPESKYEQEGLKACVGRFSEKQKTICQSLAEDANKLLEIGSPPPVPCGPLQETYVLPPKKITLRYSDKTSGPWANVGTVNPTDKSNGWLVMSKQSHERLSDDEKSEMTKLGWTLAISNSWQTNRSGFFSELAES